MAKSFLAAQSSTFTISDDNLSVIGQSGNQVITLLSTASAASFTQTVERVIFEGASNSYSYKNNAGKLEVYLASTLIATINPQDDSTGTQLTFSDNTLALSYGSAGSLTLGGVTILTTSAASLTPTTFVTTLEGDAAGASSAKIFLESSESSFTIHDDNITMVGQANTQTITIKAGVTGATLPQSIENLVFEGASTDYTYANNAGKLEVYSGSSLIATINPQDDSTGTQLAFTDKTTDVKFGTSGGLTLGGTTVSMGTPTTLITQAQVSFSNINLGTEAIATSSTFGVSSLDSGDHWQEDALTYSFNTSIPASYYEYGSKLTDNWQALSATQQATVRSIIQQIDAYLDLSFEEVSSSGDIRFNMVDTDVGGFAFYPSQTPDYAGDVFLSQMYNTDPENYGLTQGEYGWGTIVHELGHALGLKHPFEAPNILDSQYDDKNHSVMSYTVSDNLLYDFTLNPDNSIIAEPRYIYPDLYSLYDISALQSIYGADMNTNTTDDIYTLSYTDYSFQTIWDAGGEDTIDLSSALGDSTIDLSSGSLNSADEYSLDQIITLWQDTIDYAYYNTWISQILTDAYNSGELITGKNNLAIAEGVIIENLTTGNGDDTVYDNEYNNTISTGTGNDAIYLYSGGYDTIDAGYGIDTIYVNDNFTYSATDTGYLLTTTYMEALLVGVEQISYNGSITTL